MELFLGSEIVDDDLSLVDVAYIYIMKKVRKLQYCVNSEYCKGKKGKGRIDLAYRCYHEWTQHQERFTVSEVGRCVLLGTVMQETGSLALV